LLPNMDSAAKRLSQSPYALHLTMGHQLKGPLRNFKRTSATHSTSLTDASGRVASIRHFRSLILDRVAGVAFSSCSDGGAPGTNARKSQRARVNSNSTVLAGALRRTHRGLPPHRRNPVCGSQRARGPVSHTQNSEESEPNDNSFRPPSVRDMTDRACTIDHMENLQTSYLVMDVRERRIGTVSGVLNCCFELTSGESRLNLTRDSVYNVDVDRIVLICESARIPEYICTSHSPRLSPTA
jgi:hypothetical protein